MRLTQKMFEKIFLLNGCNPDDSDEDTADEPDEREDTADEPLNGFEDGVEEGHKVAGEQETINDTGLLTRLEAYYSDSKNSKYAGKPFTYSPYRGPDRFWRLGDDFKGKVLMAKDGWLKESSVRDTDFRWEEYEGIEPDFALVYVNENDSNIVDIIWYVYENVDGVKVAKAMNQTPGYPAFSEYEYDAEEDYYEFWRDEKGVEIDYRIRFESRALDDNSYELYLLGEKEKVCYFSKTPCKEWDYRFKSQLIDVTNAFVDRVQ